MFNSESFEFSSIFSELVLRIDKDAFSACYQMHIKSLLNKVVDFYENHRPEAVIERSLAVYGSVVAGLDCFLKKMNFDIKIIEEYTDTLLNYFAEKCIPSIVDALMGEDLNKRISSSTSREASVHALCSKINDLTMPEFHQVIEFTCKQEVIFATKNIFS